MSLNRRQFLQLMAIASMAGLLPQRGRAESVFERLYDIPNFGDIRLLHITDTHAQLLPVYFREPHVNLGIGSMLGHPPHLVGEALLKHFNIPSDNVHARHALTYLDFAKRAEEYGKVGGFAHLATLIKQLRGQYGTEKTLLLDGGDTWQGSGTAYWTRGQDMVEACNLLGVDVMTGHWEFTYLAEEVLANIAAFKGDFVAQNVRVKEEALFEGAPAYDEHSGHAFKPYTVKALGGVNVAIIGQAFPYTPIANPSRFIPDWTFGIRVAEMQELVNEVRAKEQPDVVVVISHNGMDVDLKMAADVTGIDVILGGHTHDGVPQPSVVKNAQGNTLVCNAGSNGKFVGVLDFAVKEGKVVEYRYHLLPVFSNLLAADPEMQAYIEQVRTPYLTQLTEELAVAEQLLYRRGNFNGTFDQVICDALRIQLDAQIALSPGFRWGTSILPGQTITMENVLDQTCITYPETYVREMSGEEIKTILEDVCDNLFNTDPYLQQGGDMVRVGGLNYVCDPTARMGQRILELALDDGKALDLKKMYKVAGWATVGSQAPGAPIWEVVANHLRDVKSVKIDRYNAPKLINVDNNPGIADY
ncbi:thiosulfohydrolase SoxB [Thioflexithrix psekupsensis]|uniref:Thiosulfohydrolase SoxB n=1 Tax=Thioflexithrix psekupsensis TaxID=1570016 RepID=A0A251X3F8_9GAMM|nr:thiosulfohydrolase SoxB [Thioflexithrix psekupsensis]OUD11991.1 thiosulfohydrolase SoxB [Thioflexithrix psekupsensis]